MRVLNLDIGNVKELTNDQLDNLIQDVASHDEESFNKFLKEFSVKQLNSFIRAKVGPYNIRKFKDKTGYSQSRKGVTKALRYIYFGESDHKNNNVHQPRPQNDTEEEDNWPSGEIYDGETLLDDDFPVYPDYFYVVDGRPMRSMIAGTVRDMKADIEQHHGHVVKEIRSCNISDRANDNKTNI